MGAVSAALDAPLQLGLSTDERWLPVVGYERLYEVSDHGRVRSLDRVLPTNRRHRGRILKQVLQSCGYYGVTLCDGRKRNLLTHALVLEAFVGPRPPGMQGCHFDDDHANNNLANLRWDTPAANSRDLIRNGRNWQVAKRHCPQGHEYTPANTSFRRNGHRRCKTCHREAEKARYDKIHDHVGGDW